MLAYVFCCRFEIRVFVVEMGLNIAAAQTLFILFHTVG